MKVKDATKAFAGACTIYLVMAACSASSSHAPGNGYDDGGNPLDPDAQPGVVDALIYPVTEAMAGPTPPTAVTENCDKMTGTVYWAEHAFPGKSVADLAQVEGLLMPQGGYPTSPGGSYTAVKTTVYLKDGYAAVPCAQAQSVMFVLP